MEQAVRIAQVLVNDDELARDVGEGFRTVKGGGVFGVEGRVFVDAVGGHLVGVVPGLPETACGVARLGGEAMVEGGGRLKIARVLGHAI
jgi:hypothetical protein